MATRSRSRGSKRSQILSLDTKMQVQNVGYDVSKTQARYNVFHTSEYINSPTTVYGEGSHSRGSMVEQRFGGGSDDGCLHVSAKIPRTHSLSNVGSSEGDSASSINDSPTFQKPQVMAADHFQQNLDKKTNTGDVELQQSSLSSDLNVIKEYAEWLRETESLLSSRVAQKKQQIAQKSGARKRHGMIRRSQTTRAT